MPDAADKAAEIIEEWNQKCIRATRTQQDGTLLCEDCDEEIPERRRQANPQARRCIACQQAAEGRR